MGAEGEAGSGAGRTGPPSIAPGLPAPGKPRRRAAAMEIAVAVRPGAGVVVSIQAAVPRRRAGEALRQEIDERAHAPGQAPGAGMDPPGASPQPDTRGKPALPATP
jgi:hypothetical protein